MEWVLLRKAKWKVEKNVSGLAADGQDRVAVEIRDLTRQVENQAVEGREKLEQFATTGASQVADLQRAIKELKEVHQPSSEELSLSWYQCSLRMSTQFKQALPSPVK